MADDVLNGEVRFLDVLRVVAGDADGHVSQDFEPAARTGESDRLQTQRLARFDGTNHVFGMTAGADPQEYVPRFPESLALSGENSLEIEVIRVRGKKQRVGR